MEDLRKVFVTIEVFNLRTSPLEKLVYGMVSLIIVAVVGAILALVIRK